MHPKSAMVSFVLIIGLLLCFSLSSCSNSASFSALPRKLVIESTQQSDFLQENEAVQELDQEYLLYSELFPRNYKILYVTNTNIFSSVEEESLVFFFRPGDVVASLLMLDYANEISDQRLLWQTSLKIKPSSEISLDILDVTNDGFKEIVVIGLTPDDKYSIEIFALNNQEAGGFYATEIFSIDTERDISIRDENGITQIILNGIDSENLLTEIIYKWNRSQSTFSIASSRKFSPQELLQNTLIELFDKDMSEWAVFLSGAWVPNNRSSKFVFFDKELMSVYLIDETSGSLLDFRWIYLGRSLAGNNLVGQLKLRHRFYPTLESWMSLALSSDDTAMITIDGYEEFNGEYIRVQQEKFPTHFDLDKMNKIQRQSSLLKTLSGSFTDSNSDSYFTFDYPELTVYSGTKSETFLYTVFELWGAMYLQMQSNNDQFFQVDEGTSSIRLLPVVLQLDSIVTDIHGFSYDIQKTTE